MKMLTLFCLLFLPLIATAQQYQNKVTSAEVDTMAIDTCMVQSGRVSLKDSTLTIDGTIYALHQDSTFTDWQDWTDNLYHYTGGNCVIRFRETGRIEEVILQDAIDDKSLAYIIW